MGQVSTYEKLLTLTLSLEQSLEVEDWESVTSLLDERDRLLTKLQPSGPSFSDQSLVANIQAAESRCYHLLQTRKSEVTKSLLDGQLGRRMRTTYGQGDATSQSSFNV